MHAVHAIVSASQAFLAWNFTWADQWIHYSSDMLALSAVAKLHMHGSTGLGDWTEVASMPL